MEHDTFVTYQSIEHHVDLTNILRVHHYRLGVVIDFDCPFSENIIDEVRCVK